MNLWILCWKIEEEPVFEMIVGDKDDIFCIFFLYFLGTREMKKMNTVTCASFNNFCQKLTEKTKKQTNYL
jgi:hypothetical protein